MQLCCVDLQMGVGRCLQCSKGFQGGSGVRVACGGECNRSIHKNCQSAYGSGGSPVKGSWRCHPCKKEISRKSVPSAMEADASDMLPEDKLALLKEYFIDLRATSRRHEQEIAEKIATFEQLLGLAQVAPGSNSGNSIDHTYSEVATSPPPRAITPANMGQEMSSKMTTPGKKGKSGNTASPAAAPPPTFAAKLSASTAPPKQKKLLEDFVPKKNNTSDIFVKTKKALQNNNKESGSALKQVQKHLSSKTIKDHIEDVTGKPGANTVVVRCTNETSRSVVTEELENAIGSEYQIEASRPKVLKSKMKVHSVTDDDLSTDPEGIVDRAQILKNIKEKNNLPPNGFIQVLQANKSRNGKTTNERKAPAQLILLVDEDVKEALRKGIKIGFSRLSLLDLGSVSLCFNCGGYNHSTRNCPQQKSTCYVCATEGHQGKDCDKWTDADSHQCPNCVNYNRKWEGNNGYEPLDVHHKAGDQNKCQIYKRCEKNLHEYFGKK